jgi:hypothetical protein
MRRIIVDLTLEELSINGETYTRVSAMVHANEVCVPAIRVGPFVFNGAIEALPGDVLTAILRNADDFKRVDSPENLA